ncbi:MAG: leucine-rich repeat protein [Clostridia bacterium]|nr:leucine-rich repeat protein [Clostridia bacterium]
MSKRLISMLLLIVMICSMLMTSCSYVQPEEPQTEQNAPVADKTDESSQTLQIFKSNAKLTQDQQLSRIKAEYLIDNGGYADSDPIVIIVTLPGDSLMDRYISTKALGSVTDYVHSAEGRAAKEAILAEQSALIDELYAEGLISEVEYSYSTVMNGVAVHTTYGNFKEISKKNNVYQTIMSDTFNRPQAIEGTDASSIVNPVDVYPTGIFNSAAAVSASGEHFTGKHTAVAVLDSGFDCEHTVFQNKPAGELLITQKLVSSILADTTAMKLDKTLELMDVYYSDKIPFVFDYADKDKNVNPYDSEHGTHVAGIIGGQDETITGIAVDTQLVLMKVFPDLDDGGKTEDILAALEDAVLLGVDAINMSLGSSCGFSREADGDAINAVYDKINQSGISLICAASNSYSSAYGGEGGNTNKASNPDSATVGSPSTYPGALSVASISGTKSKYIVANDQQIIFFNESNDISGDPNDFFAELNIGTGEGQVASKTFEYVTIPGVGMKANYAAFSKDELKGKIALVRRGENTFEDKALQAKLAGAAACIIYNNIEGDILMSMGKTDHIPTISISKEDGAILSETPRGTITLTYQNQAGPFMSDFSSWGPTSDLKLKPEITAHGGNILSSVPGGGYDELSGTSMATPNLCGIVVLIRQYLKEKYPDYTYQQISVMANQMLMSTATIIVDQQANPYSPRKQGAGLASLSNVVNTKAYLTVDGIDRTKLELGDDKEKRGVYEMTFSVVNLSADTLSYDLSLIAMTETVSKSDSEYVAEKAQILGGNTVFSAEGATISGNTLTVPANATVKVTAKYTMTESDKQMIDRLFPNGMFVEGFVQLVANDDTGIDLNIPFLAFFGDWTQAPMFDKTYYEVESEAHNAAIDDEDKLKADYYATTPYGSYYYNYIIPLGTYLYDVDTNMYDAIPATEEHIAMSDTLGTIDGLSSVYAGLLRNAKTMTYTIVDKVTGEEIYRKEVTNANKAYFVNAPFPSYEFLNLKSYQLGLVNNREYTFLMEATLDYGDGGASNNIRNHFTFDFCMDNEAPVLKDVKYEKEYDKTLKKDRFYLTMTIYDNHYVQSVTPITFTSTQTYAFLSENPIPVYSQKGQDNVVRIEITDYLEDLYKDELITSALSFSIDDYALNSNIYICQLPGTKGDFKFTKDGTGDGTDLFILSLYEDEVVDLTKYLYTSDTSVDAFKDYLRYLNWESSNEKVATVKDGQILGVKAGRTTITVTEMLDGKQTNLLINVKPREDGKEKASRQVPEPKKATGNKVVDDVNDAYVESIRFSYFDTIFAYSRAAQTSKIGETGDRHYLSAMEGGGISFYPGEKIQLFYDLDPWYVEDNYPVTFTSTNEKVAIVDENGVVTALKKGTTTIQARLDNSSLRASVKITVNSEFVIDESRTLVAYKGLGGEVVIPDDEGILYIGPFAFCLYDTDNTIELTEEDYDANKIPSTNTTVTSVVIPDSVQEIQKYAFYNCVGLKEVTISPEVRFIREYAFYGDAKLTDIDLSSVEAIGARAFAGCTKLTLDPEKDLRKTYAIGERAFENCTSLTAVDLTTLRNTGKEAFKGCTALETVVFGEKTKLSYGMFAKSGVKNVVLYETIEIPEYCFAECNELVSVTLKNDIAKIGNGAFCENEKLTAVNFEGSVDIIGEQAFYDCPALTAFELPNSEITLENYCFYECKNLDTLVFGENTRIKDINGAAFQSTAIKNFKIPASNSYYTVSSDGKLLLSKDGKTIYLAATGADFGKSYTITADVVGKGAFCGIDITHLIFTNSNTVISDYAFANCETVESVTFPASGVVSIGNSAFRYAEKLVKINLENVKSVSDYAFANTGLKEVKLADGAIYGEGVFFNSSIEKVTIGKDSDFGLGAFQNCFKLKEVVMPEAGGVSFGEGCFAYDKELETIDLSKVKIIPDQAFFECTSLRRADMQIAVKIGKYAFADCASLFYVRFPVVEEIGEGAFSQYEQYGEAPIFGGTGIDSDGKEALVLPATLKYIGDGAFMACSGIVNVVFEGNALTPPSMEDKTEEQKKEKYWNYLFAYCENLNKVVLPKAMTRIGKYAFAGCERLEFINLSHVTEIDELAFYECVYLEEIDLANAETIGFGAFTGCTFLESVGNPSALMEIGALAFQNDRNLTAFTFSESLSNIGDRVFWGCEKLVDFHYNVNGTLQKDGKINDYATLCDGILYTVLPSGKMQLTAIPGGKELETLEVIEGTVRIDQYAGNENKNIKNVILPESLKLIGNYAFYGFDALECVEFRSFVAPALESSYISDAKLDEKDPGFSILQGYYDVFELELCYYTFIDLAGKKEPIKMILPANTDVEGYDGIIYLVCFGKVEDAEHSSYVAMDRTTTNFIDYATQIEGITDIAVKHESLINNALAALNAMKQDYTQFGYTEERWQEMSGAVQSAKAKLNSIKLQSASPALQKLQADILALPDTYTSADRAAMSAIKTALSSLKPAEKVLLDLSKYTALLPAYDAEDSEIPVVPEPADISPWIIALIVLASLAVLAGVGAFVYFKLVRKPKQEKSEEKEDSEPAEEPETSEETENADESVEEITEEPVAEEESEAVEEEIKKGEDEE